MCAFRVTKKQYSTVSQDNNCAIKDLTPKRIIPLSDESAISCFNDLRFDFNVFHRMLLLMRGAYSVKH